MAPTRKPRGALPRPVTVMPAVLRRRRTVSYPSTQVPPVSGLCLVRAGRAPSGWRLRGTAGRGVRRALAGGLRLTGRFATKGAGHVILEEVRHVLLAEARNVGFEGAPHAVEEIRFCRQRRR